MTTHRPILQQVVAALAALAYGRALLRHRDADIDQQTARAFRHRKALA